MSKRFKVVGYMTDSPCYVIRDNDADNKAMSVAPIQDMLNYAEEHMPKPKKTVEDFLAMDCEKLVTLLHTVRGTDFPYQDRLDVCWEVLRPLIRKRGYHLDVEDTLDEGCEFHLWRKSGVVQVAVAEESTTTTLARFICACYLFVMQEEGEK